MTDITHPELVAALVKPGATIAAEMTPSEADLWHAATGVSGEAIEILDANMTALINSRPIDEVNLVEELGDMEFYLEQTRQNLGITRDETLALVGIRPTMGSFPESAALAVVGGDLLDAAKKVVIYKKAIDRASFVTILASIEMVMENIRAVFGFTREHTLSENIKKLSVRYAGLTYSNDAAQERADKA